SADRGEPDLLAVATLVCGRKRRRFADGGMRVAGLSREVWQDAACLFHLLDGGRLQQDRMLQPRLLGVCADEPRGDHRRRDQPIERLWWRAVRDPALFLFVSGELVALLGWRGGEQRAWVL